MLEKRTKSPLNAINRIWARSIIEELLQAGITTLCYSPGFRSSPFILESQRNEKMQTIAIVDERSNGFFSLGAGKATKTPVALLCTSGTACANLHPAILEAYYGHTPLFIITADRPSTLLGLGANQTMDQKDLYGRHVYSFVHLEAPTEKINKKDLSHLSYTVQKLNHTARSRLGPVHLNVAFEEYIDTGLYNESYQTRDRVHFVSKENKEPNPKAVQTIHSLLQEKREHSVILLGATIYSDTLLKNIEIIAEKLHIPIIADAASGIGFKMKEKFLILNSDLYLENIKDMSKIKTFIRFGAPMIDKRWSDPDFFANKELILFDEDEEARNPALGNATYISGAMENWTKQLSAMMTVENYHQNSILNELKEKELQNSSKVRKVLEEEKELTEWHVAQALHKCLPEKSNLFIGNSMPIRDFNSVTRANSKEINVFSNRGLSGIDGLIATASGIAHSTQRSTFAVIGDLSAMHDTGSLSISSTLNIENLTILIINNGGGEIFRKLTPEECPKNWFITPQKISFQDIAAAYGFQYKKINAKHELKEFLTSESQARTLVEIFVHRAANAKIRSL